MSVCDSQHSASGGGKTDIPRPHASPHAFNTLGTHWVRTHSNTTRRYCAVVISHTHLARSHARGHGTGDEVMQQREVGALEEGTAHPVRRVSEPVVVGADEHLCARRPRQTWLTGSGDGRAVGGAGGQGLAGRGGPQLGAAPAIPRRLVRLLGATLAEPWPALLSPRVPPPSRRRSGRASAGLMIDLRRARARAP